MFLQAYDVNVVKLGFVSCFLGVEASVLVLKVLMIKGVLRRTNLSKPSLSASGLERPESFGTSPSFVLA